MQAQAADVLRHVEAELDEARQRVAFAQRSIPDLAEDLQDLAEQRTDSFIELARHYLPDLSHQSMVGSWSEVRSEIEDLLLRKNDQQRGLRKEHAKLESKKQRLQTKLDQLAQEAERAKSALDSKMGNYRKQLREDPKILELDEAIVRTDRQIELALSQLKIAEVEARRKLPDYEECALFDYLRDRQFGTPAYAARGIERRWDRWVARLIEYRDAKKSFDFLSETPDVMKVMIKEKQVKYLELLRQLQSAQEDAKTKFGIHKQTDLWNDIGKQLAQTEEEMVDLRTEADALHDRIIRLDDVEGKFYRESIEIYRRFLMDLEPSVLKVYASCTDSPVDDEICARLRNLQAEFDRAQERSNEHKRSIATEEGFVAALHDLASRLRFHLRNTPGVCSVHGELDMPRLLGRMQAAELSVDDVWQTLRQAMIRSRKQVESFPDGGLGSSTDVAKKMSPLDACYIAASEQEVDGLESEDVTVDPIGILLVEATDSDIQDDQHAGFRVLAVSDSRDEAHFLVAHLESHSIPSFVRTECGDTVYAGRQFESDEYQVVVDSRKYSRAADVLRQLQARFRSAWECPKCLNRVHTGSEICWSCGRQRTL